MRLRPIRWAKMKLVCGCYWLLILLFLRFSLLDWCSTECFFIGKMLRTSKCWREPSFSMIKMVSTLILMIWASRLTSALVSSDNRGLFGCQPRRFLATTVFSSLWSLPLLTKIKNSFSATFNNLWRIKLKKPFQRPMRNCTNENLRITKMLFSIIWVNSTLYKVLFRKSQSYKKFLRSPSQKLKKLLKRINKNSRKMLTFWRESTNDPDVHLWEMNITYYETIIIKNNQLRMTFATEKLL